MFRQTLLSVAIGGCFLLPALAETSPTQDDADLYFPKDVPLVLTGSRLRQPLPDTPGAVTIVDRDLIRLSGAREIPDVLRFVPGFQVSYQSGYPLVTYHGLSGEISNRLQVLVDGRSLFMQGAAGGVDWSLVGVSLDDIDRIEIFRGSNSAAFGSNASLGVINIITRAASDSAGAYFKASWGSSSIADVSARLGGAVGSADYRLSFDRIRDDGFWANSATLRQGVTFQQYAPKTIDSLNTRIDWRLDTQDELQIQAGVLTSTMGNGLAQPNEPRNPPREVQAESNHLQLRYRRLLEVDHEWSLMMSLRRERQDAPVDVVLVGQQARFELGKRSSRDELEFQHSLRFTPTLRNVWGLGWRQESVQGPQYFATNDTFYTQVARAFGHLEWRVMPLLLLNIGGTLEDEAASGTRFAPRVMANLQLSETQTVRAGVSVAHRTPSIYEQRADFRYMIGNNLLDWRNLNPGGLRPERVIAREISYYGLFAQRRLMVDARLFVESFSEMLVSQRQSLPAGYRELLDPNQEVTEAVNGGSVKVRGAEGQLVWKPSNSTRFQVSAARLSIGANTGSASTDARVIVSAPKSRETWLAAHRFDSGIEVSVMRHRVGEMRWLDSGEPIPGYRRTDLRIAKPFRWGGHRLEAACVGQAVTGSYLESNEAQRFPRRLFLTLSAEI